MDEQDHSPESSRPPVPGGDDDWDADASMARWVADLESGRARIPEEWETEGQGVSISLGDAADLDPALLAALSGPQGLGGEALGEAFNQDGPADALRPGPVLAALTEQLVPDLGSLSDDQLTGVIQAGRREEARAAWKQTLAVAEFARRRAAQAAGARARKVPKGRRRGEFAAEELAGELVCTAAHAGTRMDRALDLTSRLPVTLAGMAAGLIDGDRAGIIAAWTASLSDADAARADGVLAAAAPGLRFDQLSRKAAALEMKLNPEGVKARKEHARLTRQRVEVRAEDSGNASLAGRELDVADALASEAYIDAVAVRVRNGGLAGGGLASVRVRVMMELLQGRNPLNLLKPRPRPGAVGDPPPAAPAPPPAAAPRRDAAPGDPGGGDPGSGGGGAGFRDPDDPGPDDPGPDDPGPDDPGPDDPGPDDPGPDDPGPDDPGRGRPDYRGDAGPGDPDDPGPDFPDDDEGPAYPGPVYAGPDGAPAWSPDDEANARHGDPGDPDDPARPRGPLRPDQPAPVPANITLIIPVGSLLGWSTAPATAARTGLLDPEETRTLVQAASRHPRTRWSATIVNPDGHAIAHGRARGQHPWDPPPGETPPPDTPPATTPPGSAPPGTAPPDPGQAARLRHLLDTLNIIFDPIARGTCDHHHAEDHYTPSRRLRDLLRARTTTCDAPGCDAQATHCDQDHTIPYPQGPTCECNLGPKCRRHHRAKQAPGWKAEQPQPGITRWTLPNGRTHTTTPTTYDT